MEKLALNHIFNPSVFRFFDPSLSNPKRPENVNFCRKHKKKFVVLASKGDPPSLNSWELMELKFGKMLGEDPKLTMAKIMGKRMNPDMSNLEIEKLFYNKKSKGIDTEIEEIPFDAYDNRLSSEASNGLNLVRPVPKKGVKFETDNKPKVVKFKKPGQPVINSAELTRSRVPNVILHKKPSIFSEEDEVDDETEKSSRLRIKPNFSLKMSKEQTKERFTDLTMIRRPEPVNLNLENEEENQEAVSSKKEFTSDIEEYDVSSLLEKPKMNLDLNDDRQEEGLRNYSGVSSVDDMAEKFFETVDLLEDQGQEMNSVSDSNTQVTVDAALQGKPKRLDQYVKETRKTFEEETVLENDGSDDNSFEVENFVGTHEIKEREDADWARAEDLVRTEGREEVEIISSSTRGYVVSFGSLVGFLPYRYLSPKWKYLAFETWLRRNDLDPASYKENLGVIGNYSSKSTNSTTLDPASLDQQQLDDKSVNLEISPGMKIEDLIKIYEREKSKFLKSFVGQKILVNVISADRTSRRLIFSSKPREKDEAIKRKKNLMARLKVGDVVKCCIVKITFFGIFVKIEGVPALIHQTEVSWDATLDPASYFKIGQIVDAKVHQLDFSLERIYLSLKELTPDPLIETFESVLSNNSSSLEEAEPETEWADVETLIKELEQFEGIESVSKGRYCLSPSLAPTFQVYMASMFENKYKLLARSENRVQEVIVETSLSKEEMKSVIQTCTNRVA